MFFEICGKRREVCNLIEHALHVDLLIMTSHAGDQHLPEPEVSNGNKIKVFLKNDTNKPQIPRIRIFNWFSCRLEAKKYVRSAFDFWKLFENSSFFQIFGVWEKCKEAVDCCGFCPKMCCFLLAEIFQNLSCNDLPDESVKHPKRYLRQIYTFSRS